MATRKKAATKAGSGPTKPAGGAEALIDALAPPQAALVRAFCELLLALDPRVQQDVKWNSPSFRTSDHFATLHLRDPRKVFVILHFGVAGKAQPVCASASRPRLAARVARRRPRGAHARERSAAQVSRSCAAEDPARVDGRARSKRRMRT
jgi:hypothetical protein